MSHFENKVHKKMSRCYDKWSDPSIKERGKRGRKTENFRNLLIGFIDAFVYTYSSNSSWYNGKP